MAKKSKDDFTPIIIGRDESAEQTYKRNLKAKRDDITALYDYCVKFIDIEDKSLLYKDFKNTFLKLFYDKYQSQFPSIVTLEKMLDFASVDIALIERLASQIESVDIALDKEMNALAEVDFNIYTKNHKENLLFACMKRMSQDINTLKKNGVNIFPIAIQNGTMQTLKYNFRTQTLEPNLIAVRNMQRG